MNATHNAPCSEITLPEIVGLITGLLLKLKGPNGRKWLGWLKKFDRKENAWVPSRPLASFRVGDELPTLSECLAELAALETKPFEGMVTWASHQEKFRFPLPDGAKIVEVRLGDLMPDEELLSCSYSDILARAEQEGFGRCDPRLGLAACVTLARKAVGSSMNNGGLPVSYVVCTDPIHLEGEDGVDRVPEFWVWPGLRSQQSRGGATLYAINSRLTSPRGREAMRTTNLIENPDTRLIFTSEA